MRTWNVPRLSLGCYWLLLLLLLAPYLCLGLRIGMQGTERRRICSSLWYRTSDLVVTECKRRSACAPTIREIPVACARLQHLRSERSCATSCRRRAYIAPHAVGLEPLDCTRARTRTHTWTSLARCAAASATAGDSISGDRKSSKSAGRCYSQQVSETAKEEVARAGARKDSEREPQRRAVAQICIWRRRRRR